MRPDRTLENDWHPGIVPVNVDLEAGAYLETTYSFHLCRSRAPVAVRILQGASVYLGTMFDLGPEATVHIGRFALVNGARISSEASVFIGDYCLISWNVTLMDSFRLPRLAADRRRELEQIPSRQPRLAAAGEPGRPIRLERNVWVGFDACILPGVTVGEGSVVGARSVVVEDVPAFSVAVGNPARIIRRLDPAATHLNNR